MRDPVRASCGRRQNAAFWLGPPKMGLCKLETVGGRRLYWSGPPVGGFSAPEVSGLCRFQVRWQLSDAAHSFEGVYP